MRERRRERSHITFTLTFFHFCSLRCGVECLLYIFEAQIFSSILISFSSKGSKARVDHEANSQLGNWGQRSVTTRHAGVVGLWGAPPQRPPGSSPNGNCRNGGAILARAKTAPLPVPPSKRMKSPSNIMRQSSLTKLGSMINTAVNKRAGKSFDHHHLSVSIVSVNTAHKFLGVKFHS